MVRCYLLRYGKTEAEDKIKQTLVIGKKAAFAWAVCHGWGIGDILHIVWSKGYEHWKRTGEDEWELKDLGSLP